VTWEARALCLGHREPELWFPVRGGDYSRARAICRACPVRLECLSDAIATEPGSLDERHGMRGGLTPPQRHRLARLFGWRTARAGRNELIA